MGVKYGLVVVVVVVIATSMFGTATANKNWSNVAGKWNQSAVFKYDPPNDTTFPHSVYLLPNFWSFQNCDLKRAKKVGGVNEGGGAGFEFVLKRWQPYYFACGERDGVHCKLGLMKFAVWPLIRSL
ncbi:Cupredoxin superfamily protein [Perilla frutescens var. hirtella]|uniref:Cupredoxin superfamily protein n=1 Tax=Perilla frutescens var. hirtella TaxID=608512 RepID=A0AAD4JIE6_PERFH|nr:Cupredoxin superfamily protein [Perilla frutescens var. frutescens]KAH6834367.1 Cupredoxin superfamily protein [Perilla frutescens var. hirtella]